MDTVFSSGGVYKVSARAGQYTLDECAVIGSDTPIYPYFISSVNEDPDIWKLTVFLQSLNGEILSKKVTYIIDPGKEDSTFESGSWNSSGETGIPNSPFNAGSGYDAGSGFTTGSGYETDSGFTTGSGYDADSGFTTGSGYEADSGYGAGFPFETDPWDGTAGETGEIDGAYRFFKRETSANSPLPYTDNEDVIYVKKLGGNLPPLSLPRNMEPGQYILVFQVIGKQGVLHQIEAPFYYTGTSRFALDDIHAYLPGIFDRGHLVPPELPVMLETKLAAGAGLNPYVIWYNGKKRIHEGYVADGAARFIWQAPAQTGFHILKVEAFPFKPLNTGMRTPVGKVKELSLPVSAKNENFSFAGIPAGSETGFSGKDLIPVRRYQLFADLKDSRSSGITGNILAAMNHTPEWLPRGNIFGLAVGPAHVFSIPGPLFTSSPQDEGHLLFRFIPLADGTIFSGSFDLKPALERKNGREPGEWFERLNMDLSYAGGTVILNYSAGTVSGKRTVFLHPGQTEGVITAVVSFQVQKDTLRLSLGLNTPGEFLPDEGIPLPGPLTGSGTFLLGTLPGEAGTGTGARAEVPPIQTSSEETAEQISPEETDDPEFTAEADGRAEEIPGSGPAVGVSRLSVTESKPPSPVIILDEFVFFVAMDTSFSGETQTATEDSALPGEIQEDVSEDASIEDIVEKDVSEVIADDSEDPQNDSGETAGEPEITATPLPPVIDGETDTGFILAE
ncbi:MAG: hypothetical protein LBH57_07940 [Treponema sp.]|nr:hypothetical protein [Treponema sp.]